MNKRRIVIVALSLVSMAWLPCKAAKAPKKPWTFFVYIAGDNNLAQFVTLDLGEMMKVGSNANAHIIAYTTEKQVGKPKQTNRYEVLPGSLKKIGSTTVEDSGSVATFKKALEWAVVNYPSDRIAVVLWDHGSGTLNPGRSPQGWKGICWDDTTHHFLTDRDCCDVFKYVNNTYRNGKKIDIVACDACLMASLEVAHTFRTYVDYFVASEENIPGYGYQYARALAPLKNGNPKPVDFAKSMVKAYDDAYKTSGWDYTLSALDLKQLDAVVTNLNKIAQFFISQLKTPNKTNLKQALAALIAPAATIHYGTMDYIDLYQWLSNIQNNIVTMKLSTQDTKTLKDLITATLPLITKAVLARCNSKNYAKSYGMTIYFPRTVMDSSYKNLLWTGAAQWTSFLQAYLKK
ncbi:MAG: clostripain-related cysteine peptidase [Candidatus Babeliales bacterium]